MSLPVVVITLGDPAGIGPEIVLKSIARPEVRVACRPVVVGSANVLAEVSRRLGLAPAAFAPLLPHAPSPWRRRRVALRVAANELCLVTSSRAAVSDPRARLLAFMRWV